MRKDLLVCVSTFNRPEYTKDSLKSLAKNYSGAVKIYDDVSHSLLREWISSYADRKGWEFKQNERNLGYDRNVSQYKDNFNYDLIYFSDNDVIYSSQFEKQLDALASTVVATGGVGSLFNSKEHRHHVKYANGLPPVNGYQSVQTFGSVSMLITRDLLEKAIEWYWQSNFTAYSIDYGIMFYCQLHAIPRFRTYASYINHIGKVGLHSNGTGEDKAYDFIE